MRRVFLAAAALLLAIPLSAQTADEIIAKYVKTIGGMDRIESIKSVRRTGKFTGGGGFQAGVVQENRRPNAVREEFTIQGMTGINAYDGKTGWKIEPWEGKKDPEPLGEDEFKEIVQDSDFDGPIVHYADKGNKVEYLGTEPVEGTDAYKLRVTLADGDVFTYYMDSDYFVPIKIERKRFVRGAERESEVILGDYKEVAGVYFPFSFEAGPKGSSERSKVTWSKIEANVPLDDSRFVRPGAGGKPPEEREGKPVDASQTQPKPKDEKKPLSTEEKKPPLADAGAAAAISGNPAKEAR